MTATDDELVEGYESLTLNGLVGDTAVGSVTLTIEDNDAAITYMLSGPADSNIVEGESYEMTASASSAVQADTTVETLRDASASDADEDDYSVEPIIIEAGETTGSTTLMVTEDDLPDGGTGTTRRETLVVFGSVGGMEIGDLTFTIWDTAVPALPVGGVLLLGALLLWRGRLLARDSRGVVADGPRAADAGASTLLWQSSFSEFPEMSSRAGLSLALAREEWPVRPALRSGLNCGDDGDVTSTLGSSPTFGRKYGARFTVDRWDVPGGTGLDGPVAVEREGDPERPADSSPPTPHRERASR